MSRGVSSPLNPAVEAEAWNRLRLDFVGPSAMQAWARFHVAFAAWHRQDVENRSQKDLANELGLRGDSQISRARKQPNPGDAMDGCGIASDKLTKAAKLFKVTPGWLINGAAPWPAYADSHLIEARRYLACLKVWHMYAQATLIRAPGGPFIVDVFPIRYDNFLIEVRQYLKRFHGEVVPGDWSALYASTVDWMHSKRMSSTEYLALYPAEVQVGLAMLARPISRVRLTGR